MHDIKRVLVIIPAYNEESALPVVLKEIESESLDVDVLVIDDGSSDGTTAVAKAQGVDVVTLPLNCGVGGCVQTGFIYAAQNNYDCALQVDADGQHPAEEIPNLIRAVQAGADVAIGGRFSGKGDYQVKGPRRWMMRLLSAFFSRFCKTKITDSTSGFKAYSARAIEIYAKDYPAYYLGDTIEALVIAVKSGLKVVQVPVNMRPRYAGKASHNPLKAAVFLARTMGVLIIALSRPRVKE